MFSLLGCWLVGGWHPCFSHSMQTLHCCRATPDDSQSSTPEDSSKLSDSNSDKPQASQDPLARLQDPLERLEWDDFLNFWSVAHNMYIQHDREVIAEARRCACAASVLVFNPAL